MSSTINGKKSLKEHENMTKIYNSQIIKTQSRKLFYMVCQSTWEEMIIETRFKCSGHALCSHGGAL